MVLVLLKVGWRYGGGGLLPGAFICSDYQFCGYDVDRAVMIECGVVKVAKTLPFNKWLRQIPALGKVLTAQLILIPTVENTGWLAHKCAGLFFFLPFSSAVKR